ncbi:acyl-CoA dehydrogenase family protein [Castellaniella sp.]|uniref:acyl-CoA dehydrogenase family protein n=1 Tax=Castellaniella sp. TaxID=1955812 RepID=UPI0035690ACB
MKNTSSTESDDVHALARWLVARVSDYFETAVDHTALQCSQGGRLDGRRLDAHQWVCYELALICADLFSAKTIVDSLPAASSLDERLGLAYVSSTVGQLLARLKNLYLDLGIDTASLQLFMVSDEISRLYRQAGHSTILAQLGSLVADHEPDLAAVELDEMAAMARDAFSRFATDRVAPLAEEIHREDRLVPEPLLEQMSEMGVFGLAIPEQYGGSDSTGSGNVLAMIAVTEALSEASLGAAGSLMTRPEILVRALMAGGTQAQKDLWLPRIASGNPLCAVAITEPDYGSDVASLALKGTRVPGGWLLNGAKTWCTFAGKAGVIMVVARTDPDRSLGYRGLSVFLVEKPSFDGYDFSFRQDGGGQLDGRAISTIGYRGMHSFDLSFQDFYVPDSHVVGGEDGLGNGFYYTMAGMVGGRVQTAARALGVMRAALKEAIRYSKDRVVFGAPLIQYPLTAVKLAHMACRFLACRELTYAVARQVNGGGGRMEASLAKLLACRSAEIVTREALQLHGGMGYAEETPVSRYFVDARVLSIFEGAEETLALKVIARNVLEDALARKTGTHHA